MSTSPLECLPSDHDWSSAIRRASRQILQQGWEHTHIIRHVLSEVTQRRWSVVLAGANILITPLHIRLIGLSR